MAETYEVFQSKDLPNLPGEALGLGRPAEQAGFEDLTLLITRQDLSAFCCSSLSSNPDWALP